MQTVIETYEHEGEFINTTKCPKCDNLIDINEYYYHIEYHSKMEIDEMEGQYINNVINNYDYEWSQLHPEKLYEFDDLFPEMYA